MSSGQLFIPGRLTTFRYQDDINTEFINDGRQRMGALEKIFGDIRAEGKTEDEAYDYLEKVHIYVDKMVYAPGDTAGPVIDYVVLNDGSPMISEYYGKAILYHHLGADTPKVYECIDKAINIVEQSANVCGIKLQSKYGGKDTNKSAIRRGIMSLFYRYVTEEKEKENYDLSDRQKWGKVNHMDEVLEAKFAEFIKTVGTSELERWIGRFSSTMEGASGLIKYIWGEVLLEKNISTGKPITSSSLMFLLHVYVHCTNRKYLVSHISEWLKDFLTLYAGGSALNLEKEDGSLATCTFGSGQMPLSRITKDMEKKLQKSYFTTRVPIRGQRSIGFEEHHPEPFSKHGNGPTTPIPKVLNRSFGNKEVET